MKENAMKVLSIEYDERDKMDRIENIWYCSIDNAKMVLSYCTTDDTVTLKTLSLENVDRVTLYLEENEEPNVCKMNNLFTWHKNFEKNLRKWED